MYIQSLWTLKDYIQECLRQLNNQNYYEKLTTASTILTETNKLNVMDYKMSHNDH